MKHCAVALVRLRHLEAGVAALDHSKQEVPNGPSQTAGGCSEQARTRQIAEALAQVAGARLRCASLVAEGKLAPGAGAGTVPSRSLPGYTLSRELHRGGQGIVYLAIQQSTGREVAVKVLHRGPHSSPAEIARFQREVEALSRLKHPNVVTIHDCGKAGDEIFLVMDHVGGRPLDSHVAFERPAVRETLELFAECCDGVNAAHLRGVIHRDLKPSNIRVDHSGRPRVLDFGLAKVIHAYEDRPPASTTQPGQFVGSLPWASPEQATGRADAVDMRSDVYSLGVILYQLLTGRFPYPVSGRMDDAVRHIVETDPVRPSSIERLIDLEIETILLKCLSKEPDRRYQSAGELARDIRHYLEGEPIEAKRDSLSYVLRKQFRRHWMAVSVAVGFLVLISAGLIASLTFWYRAERALLEAERQRGLTAERARETQQVADFQSVMLSRISPSAIGRGIRETLHKQVESALQRQYVGEYPNRRKRTPEEVAIELGAYDEPVGAATMVDVARTVVDDYMLKPAVAAADKQFSGQLLVQAQIRKSIARTYHAMGLYDSARPLIEMALQAQAGSADPDEAEIADLLADLAAVDFELGDYAAAVKLNDEALSKRRAQFGNDSPMVAPSLRALADALLAQGMQKEAEAPAQEAVAISRRVGESADQGKNLETLARILQAQGRMSEAEPVYRESYEIQQAAGIESEEALARMQNYAQFLSAQSNFASAEAILREALRFDQHVLGYEHPLVATHLNTLAYALHHHGDYEGAEPFYREALALRRRILGDDHPDVGRSLNNIAVLLADKGDLVAAEPMQREALEQRKRALGANHPDVARTLNNLAMLLQKKGDYAGAEPVAREALALRRKALGDEHKDVAFGMANLAIILTNLDQFDEAQELADQALLMQRRLLGDDNALVAYSLHILAGVMYYRGDHEKAESTYRDALARRRKVLGDRHAETAQTIYSLGTLLHAEQRDTEAEALAREAIAVFEKAFPHGHALLASSYDLLAGILVETNRAVEAEPYARQAVDLCRRVHQGDHDGTAGALSTLAQCLSDQHDDDAARAAIVEAADMIQRLHPPGHRLCQPILARRDKITPAVADAPIFAPASP